MATLLAGTRNLATCEAPPGVRGNAHAGLCVCSTILVETPVLGCAWAARLVSGLFFALLVAAVAVFGTGWTSGRSEAAAQVNEQQQGEPRDGLQGQSHEEPRGPSGPARLSAERITVDMEARRARAEGNVSLVFGNVTITCDSLEVDTSSGELIAAGHVELRDAGDIVRGDALSYSLKTKKGSVTHGVATMTGEGVDGEVYVSGRELASEPGKITVKDGTFTTCDLDEPHYHVEAGEMEVYVDDRMVLRNVSYWEGKTRLLYWPYLVLPIRDENRFELPKVGYGENEGWFVKTTYNYYRNPSFRGSLYLDYLSKLGVGAGVKHFYDAGTVGSGFVYLYGVANASAAHMDSKVEISHDLSLGPEIEAHVGLKHSDAVSSAGVLNTELKGVLGLEHTDDRGFIDLSVERTARTGADAGDETRASAALKRTLEAGLSIAANATYLDSRVPEGYPGYDEKFLNYKVDVSKDTPVGFVSAVWEQYVKPREREEQEEEGEVDPLPYEAIGRAPEITFESAAFGLGSLPLELQVDAVYGRYSERPSGWAGPDMVKAARTELAIRVPSQSFDVLDGVRATVSGGLAFDSYTTGASRYVASAVVGAETAALGGAVRLKGGYEYKGVFGETPFAFDTEVRKGLLTAGLTVSSRPVTFSMDGGYDFYTGVYKDLIGRLRVSTGDAWAVEARASYDPNGEAMREAIGKIEISASERCSVKVGARYSFPLRALDRVESDVDLDIGNAWNVRWTVVYGGPSKDLVRGDVGVTRDLHCREIRLSYSYTDDQVWLEYRIKAFPYEGLKFGLGDQGILF